MSATYIFTLTPSRVFSTGRGDSLSSGPGIHSDTLAGALRCVAEETGLAGRLFAGTTPPFTVSSVFPQVGGVRLYPRPVTAPPSSVNPGSSSTRGEGSALPVWRSIRLVTEARLESLAGGRRVRLEPADIVHDEVWGMPSERSLAVLPRPSSHGGVLVDRVGGEVSRFSRAGISFPPGARLFFLVRFQDPSLLPALKELVAHLGEAGLGARRSTGAGQFALSGAHSAPGFLSHDSGERDGSSRSVLLLSLYLPRREEVEQGVLDGASTRTLLRGGWIHSGGPTPHRKLRVRMLVEGTVLPRVKGSVEGEVRDVTPPGFERHRVQRDGRALSIDYRGGS